MESGLCTHLVLKHSTTNYYKLKIKIKNCTELGTTPIMTYSYIRRHGRREEELSQATVFRFALFVSHSLNWLYIIFSTRRIF